MSTRSKDQQARIDEVQAIEALMRFAYWRADVTLILRHDRLCELIHDTAPASSDLEESA